MSILYKLILALPQGDAPPADPNAAEPGGFGNMFFLFFILIAVMLLMPLFSKKDRGRRKRITDLKKHDKVVTTGGIFGTIISIDEDTVMLEIARDTRIKIKRSSVFDVERATDAKAEPAGKKAGAKG